MDCGPPGSSVHGILQARTLEWVAISFSRGFSRSGHKTRISCVSCVGGRFLPLSRLGSPWAGIRGLYHQCHRRTPGGCCCAVAKPCPTLCDSTLQHARLPCPSLFPGARSNSCRVSDIIQPSHPLSSPSPLALSLAQCQDLFQ